MPREFENRVFHEDTDFIGIVYYANYFKFIERARSEAIRDVGIDQATLKTEFDIVFVVSNLEANFIKSAKFNDLLLTRTGLIYIKSASIGLSQKIFRDKELIFTADIKLVSINSKGTPKRIPICIKNSILSI